MKNVSIIFIVLLLNFPSAIAQNVLIEYDAAMISKQYRYELILGDTQSYWRHVQNDQAAIQDNLLDGFVIKDFQQDATFSNTSILGTTFYIKDTLNNMNWTLTDDKKNILGKECFSAKTRFRGRDYIAYYSPELLYANGPWKFGGLPGLILEIFSVDNMYRYIATKIDFKNAEKLDYVKPLKNKFVSWDQYKVDYNDAFLKFTKAIRASGVVDDAAEINIKLETMEFIDGNSQSKNGYKF